MDKEGLIQYLSDQLTKVNKEGFNLDSWKLTTVRTIDSLLGPGNTLSKSISMLQYEEKISYEELYPKRIKDLPSSLAKFKSVIQEVIDQLNSMPVVEPVTLTRSQGVDMMKTLKYHLKGSQIESIEKALENSNTNSKKEALLSIIESIDSSTLHQIITDLLSELPPHQKP